MVCPSGLAFYLASTDIKHRVETKILTQVFCFFTSWTPDQDSEEGKATEGLPSLLFV